MEENIGLLLFIKQAGQLNFRKRSGLQLDWKEFGAMVIFFLNLI